VETAVLNVGASLERVHATEKAIEQAKESLRIEREKYDLGKGAIVDVLDAQSALLDSQTNYYRALADYNVALAQLRLATGAQEP
jgi:outer membrane protein